MKKEDHEKTANDLAIAQHYLIKAYNRCSKNFLKQTELITNFKKILPGAGSYFDRIRPYLENDINDDSICYYRLEERYKKLKNE